MTSPSAAAAFEPLTIATLPQRLHGIAALTQRIGADAASWKVREVGDGNLNLVFIVDGPSGSAVVKQALPYVRLVGDSWPLPLKRSFFEYHALTRQQARAPGAVPEIFHFDQAQALIVMEYLSPHIILRKALMMGRELPGIAEDLGLFTAQTLFRGSDLHMSAAARKADLALFADNVEICDITESLVFTDPYFDAPRNRHTSPQLDALVAQLRADRDLKVEAQRMKHLFAANAETLLHGDLHTGSIMVTDEETKVIDPEFAFYGPIAFDIGMLLANFWMSYFSQGDTSRTARGPRCGGICCAPRPRSGRCSGRSFRGCGAANARACCMRAACSRTPATPWAPSRRWTGSAWRVAGPAGLCRGRDPPPHSGTGPQCRVRDH